MAFTEVFPNPTVKEVIFQIRYPNLFFIENKIGDIQIKLMQEFPETSLLFRKQVVFADIIANDKQAFGKNEDLDEGTRKIWQFKNDDGVTLNILSDSLDIVSKSHKTYNNDGSVKKFRDIIELVVKTFIEITGIPMFARMGLRYLDECPISELTNQNFRKSFNTSFNLNRFDISNVSEMAFATVINHGKYNLRFQESLKRVGSNNVLILDFDGFAGNVPSGNFLSILDDLHRITADEFQRSIKAPIVKHMKKHETNKL